MSPCMAALVAKAARALSAPPVVGEAGGVIVGDWAGICFGPSSVCMIASSWSIPLLAAMIVWDGASFEACWQWKAEVLILSDSPAEGRGITDSVRAATSANDAMVC